MPDTFRFDAGTALRPRVLADGWVEVTFHLRQTGRLVAELPASAASALLRLDGSFTRTQLSHALGGHRAAGQMLSRLRGHGLVHPVTAGAAQLRTEPVVLDGPSGIMPLAYYQTALDGDPCGFGVSASPRLAAASANGEAWERRGLLRPDLTRREAHPPGLVACAGSPGLLFDFLRAAAPLSGLWYPAVQTRVVRRDAAGTPVGLCPGEWIYPDASAASNSNGVASGPDLSHALTAARLELVERDALLRAWYGLVPSRPLEPGVRSLGPLLEWRRLAAAAGLDARWFVLGTGRIRTVACVVSGSRRPHLGLGSAARPSLLAAASKAFLEAAGSHLGHVLAHRQLGSRTYARMARGLTARATADFHRNTFEAFWAALPRDAVRVITERFSRPAAPSRHALATARFRWLELTPRDSRRRRVVKVFHPDAMPLPNTMAQVRLLEALLGVRGDGTPPPIS